MRRDSMVSGRLAVLVGFALVGLLAAPSGAAAQKRVTVDQDNPDRQEIYRETVTVLFFDAAKMGEECLPPVPEGKRLVIEHLTARVMLQVGQTAYAALKDGGIQFATFLPLTIQTTEVGGDPYYVSATSARLRFDAGQAPCFILVRDSLTGQATGRFTANGYLITMAPQ